MGLRLHDTSQKFPSGEAFDTSTPDGMIKSLSQQKYQIEAELQRQYGVLSLNGTDISSPLTDTSGFPRDDIPDLASVRVARAKIHELRNDLRAIVDRIAGALPLWMPPNKQSDESQQLTHQDATHSTTSLTPFAKVDTVSPNSPAELAGLKVGDQLVRYGHVNATNHDSLRALVTATAENEGMNLNLVWFRYDANENRQMICKVLTPRSGWGGRGLIGCHIVPL